MFRLMPLSVAAVVLVVPAAASADPGWSAYDTDQAISITGPMTDVSWGEPHGAARVRHGGALWDVILASAARMEARGLSKEILASGQAVTLEGYPRRDGVAELRIERLTVAGRTVELR